MKLTARDRRALAILGAAVVVVLLFYFWPESSPVTVVGGIESIPLAERRLERVRQLASAVPGREDALKKATSELAIREKGLIQADTANQAQAQLLEILRRVSRNQSPALEIRGMDLGQPKPFGDAYGEVSVTLLTTCRVEQLLNFMADLTAQPELIATRDFQIGQAGPKDKMMTVRVSVSALVPRKLIPEKKGLF